MESRIVTSVAVLDGYRLRLTFDDGTEGVVDLDERLWGPMFEPLRDPEVFARVRVDAGSGTIVWPNGADIAPETLYDEVRRSTTAP
jgi:hypothetical protein